MRTYIGLVVFSSMLAAGLAISSDATADTQTQAAAIDRIFSPWSKPDSPGCAVAVTKDGRIVFERGYGLADLDHDVRITPATVFDVGHREAIHSDGDSFAVP